MERQVEEDDAPTTAKQHEFCIVPSSPYLHRVLIHLRRPQLGLGWEGRCPFLAWYCAVDLIRIASYDVNAKGHAAPKTTPTFCCLRGTRTYIVRRTCCGRMVDRGESGQFPPAQVCVVSSLHFPHESCSRTAPMPTFGPTLPPGTRSSRR